MTNKIVGEYQLTIRFEYMEDMRVLNALTAAAVERFRLEQAIVERVRAAIKTNGGMVADLRFAESVQKQERPVGGEDES